MADNNVESSMENNQGKYRIFKTLLAESKRTGGRLRIYLKNSFQISGTFNKCWDDESFWFRDEKTGKEQVVAFDFISTMGRA